jgi:cytoskeleton protein RodZ
MKPQASWKNHFVQLLLAFFTAVFKWKIPIAIGVVLLSVIIAGTIFYESVSLTDIERLKKRQIKNIDKPLFKLEKTQQMREALAMANQEASGKTEQESTAETAAAPATKEAPEETEQEIGDNGERLYPTREFYPITNSMFSLDYSADELEDDDIYPDEFRARVNTNRSNVYIKAISGDTWLAYKIDGQDINNLVLRQGGSLELVGDIVRLYLGNINVTSIFYNNALVKTDSRTGVKSLIFPENIQKNYKLPLFVNDANGVLRTSEDYIRNMQREEQKQASAAPTTN